MIGGGSTRTASLLEFFAPRFAIDMILFAEEGSPDPAEAVPRRLVRSVSTLRLPRHRKTLLARTGRNFTRYLQSRPPLIDRFSGLDQPLSTLLAGRRYTLGIVEHFWCAPYVSLLRRHCADVWLDLHNIESVWHARLAKTENFFLRPALTGFASVCRKLECELLPLFSRILVPSENDLQELGTAAGTVPVTVYPNALPWIDPPERSGEEAIIFTACVALAEPLAARLGLAYSGEEPTRNPALHQVGSRYRIDRSGGERHH
jgi:hypothetical protein